MNDIAQSEGDLLRGMEALRQDDGPREAPALVYAAGRLTPMEFEEQVLEFVRAFAGDTTARTVARG